MIVYRVEQKEVPRHGPFHHFTSRTALCLNSSLPAWHEDFRGQEYDSSKYTGMTDLEHVHQWFLNLRELEEAGFILAVYDAEPDDIDFGKSELQCRFVLDRAKRLRNIPLTEVML